MCYRNIITVKDMIILEKNREKKYQSMVRNTIEQASGSYKNIESN